MRIPGYPDALEIARAAGGLSAIEGTLARDFHEQQRMIVNLQRVAELRQEMAALDHGGMMEVAKLRDAMTSAVEAARVAGYLNLPDVLDQYRQSDANLALRLIDAQYNARWLHSHLDALNVHTALSDMLDQTGIVGRDVVSAVDSVLASQLSGVDSFRQVRDLLNFSGLLRLPRIRRLSDPEKRQRVKLLLKDCAPSADVRKAHSFVHRYELVLRDVIVKRMQDAYGENWEPDRLPLCGCKKLLGKQVEGDEIAIDHADFAHYALIMCHAEHFDAIFSKGFDSAEDLREMILRVGRLRARAQHARTFTGENLRALMVLLRAIEAGLCELVDDVVIES